MNPKTIIKRDKPYSVSFKTFNLNKNYKTAHWVGYYRLNKLYINDFFKGKQKNEDTEAELTEMV